MDLRNIIKYSSLFIFLILFQIIILDNIQISNLGLKPFMYLLLILLLPFETPKWITLVVALILGLTMDLFNDTPGIHSSATIFMAFIRPVILNSFSPRDGYESGTLPRIHFLGLPWFLKYSLSIIIVHNTFYFFIEKFNFADFHITLLKIIFTTIFSTFFIVLSQYFIFRKE
jgi:rod shape-determining protein MreD